MAAVVSVNPRNRAAGTYAFQAPSPIAAGLVYARFVLTIELADKLAVGKAVEWSFEFSNDSGASWQLGNRGTWQSYGPTGLTYTGPDGVVVVNPDPELTLGLSDRGGQLCRGTLILSSALRTGITIDVT